MPTRRTFVTGLLAGLGAASPAAAQFGNLLQQLPGGGGGGGGGLDLNRLLGAAGSIFEGMQLGEKDEIQMAETMYGPLIDQSGGAYKNRRAQSALQRFAEPLFATSARPNLPWEITLLNDDAVNAWALPGGKLAINRGLMRHAAREEDLAAVIAHEIGHAELSHALSEMRTQKFSQGLTDIGREAVAHSLRDRGAAGGLTDMALEQLQGPLLQLVSTGYSRAHEGEADAHILSVFQKTGHDPRKASGFFRTLLEITPESEQTTSLYSTHPATRERIAAIEDVALKTPPAPHAAANEGWTDLKKSFPTRRG